MLEELEKVLREGYERLENWDDAVIEALEEFTGEDSKHWMCRFLEEASEDPFAEVPTRLSSDERGSISRIATYAHVLPFLVRARIDLFRQEEPLEDKVATEWLKKAIEDGEEATWVEVRLKYLVPSSAVGEAKEIASELNDDPVGLTRKLATLSQLPIDGPVANAEVLVDEGSGEFGGKVESFGFSARTGRLARLYYWADALATSLSTHRRDVLGFYNAFVNALHLILVGQFDDIDEGVDSYVYKAGFSAMSSDKQSDFYADSMICIDVSNLETTPAQVADSYAQTRARLGRNQKGKRFDRCAEKLAFMALDLRETEDTAMGDRGFYRELLKRWREYASLFDDESVAEHFKDTEDVRNALRRIDAAHRRAVERNFQSQGENRGPIPSLFRRG